jgi:hypothetical protein
MTNDKSIVRVKKNTNYSVVDNTAALDTRLSWKAKGIIFYALTRPDDWQFYLCEISKRSTDGIDSVRSGMAELIKYGYVTRERKQDDKGKFYYEYTIYEIGSQNQPYAIKPYTDNPHAVNPYTDNPTLLNTDNNQILNKLNTECMKESEKEKRKSGKDIDSNKDIIDYTTLEQKKEPTNMQETEEKRQRAYTRAITDGYGKITALPPSRIDEERVRLLREKYAAPPTTAEISRACELARKTFRTRSHATFIQVLTVLPDVLAKSRVEQNKGLTDDFNAMPKDDRTPEECFLSSLNTLREMRGEAPVESICQAIAK